MHNYAPALSLLRVRNAIALLRVPLPDQDMARAQLALALFATRLEPADLASLDLRAADQRRLDGAAA